MRQLSPVSFLDIVYVLMYFPLVLAVVNGSSSFRLTGPSPFFRRNVSPTAVAELPIRHTDALHRTTAVRKNEEPGIDKKKKMRHALNNFACLHVENQLGSSSSSVKTLKDSNDSLVKFVYIRKPFAYVARTNCHVQLDHAIFKTYKSFLCSCHPVISAINLYGFFFSVLRLLCLFHFENNL